MAALLDEYAPVSDSTSCPMCGRSDWCLVARDGRSAICQRTPSDMPRGSAGWYHELEEIVAVPKRKKAATRKLTTDECRKLHDQYNEHKQVVPKLKELATELRIEWWSLLRLQVGWDGDAYTFPMRDESGRICGFQRRFPNRSKFFVPGSRMGLFMPAVITQRAVVYVCEGATDTAAALHLGLHAIGRPNCRVGDSTVLSMLKACGATHAVVVADNDKPDQLGRRAGQDGAMRLSEKLLHDIERVTVVAPVDCKDLCDYVTQGGTVNYLEGITTSVHDNLCWRHL